MYSKDMISIRTNTVGCKKLKRIAIKIKDDNQDDTVQTVWVKSVNYRKKVISNFLKCQLFYFP